MQGGNCSKKAEGGVEHRYLNICVYISIFNICDFLLKYGMAGINHDCNSK
ncbi:hypothetical protein Cri9333_4242 [Crinalium epipsammum PCC 9333]|uniref:Uncharacterized protein n=1 Tax=Crinalium epipsammum PCC 9333 TaxID=1173022 RepID=K9W4B9_9CYAN|nr:hypothetical protein Cri9333_4242 [Crinalium epipsammum PCC 9333]